MQEFLLTLHSYFTNSFSNFTFGFLALLDGPIYGSPMKICLFKVNHFVSRNLF